MSCGICGTDLHIHTGDFASRMPVVTGHETSGIVVKLGAHVQNLHVGQKVTADNAEVCGHCHYCQKGDLLYCETFAAHGIHCEWVELFGSRLVYYWVVYLRLTIPLSMRSMF